MFRGIFIIISLISLSIYSRDNHRIDSLKRELEICRVDTSISKLCLILGKCYMKKQIDTSLVYYTKAHEYALKSNNQKLLAKSLNELARVNVLNSSYSKASEYCGQAMEIYIKLGDSVGIADEYKIIGSQYYFQGTYDIALEYYLKSLEICKLIKREKSYASLYNNIAVIHESFDNLDLAMKNYRIAYDYNLKYDRKIGLMKATNNIGGVFYKKDEYDSALVYFTTSLSLGNEVGDKFNSCVIYRNIGRIYSRKKQFKIALEYYRKSVQIAIECGNITELTETYSYMTQLLIKKKSYKRAAEVAQEALVLAEKHSLTRTKCWVYRDLSKVYEKMGQFPQALKCQKKYKEVNDILYKEEKLQHFAEMQVKFESKEKEKENELLRKDNQIHILALSKQKNIRNSLIGFSILVILLVAIISNRFRTKQKANIQLKKYNDIILKQQKELSINLIHLEAANNKLENKKEVLQEANATKNKFFSIIAHDLKNPFNVIMGFSNLLHTRYDKLSDEKRIKYISAINSSAKTTYEFLINLLVWARTQLDKIELKIQEINLLELAEIGIEPYLLYSKEKEVEIINKIQKGITVKVDRFTIQTVIGNLVNNAIKFTPEGGQISVTAKTENSHVEVSVQDNGVGMTKEDLSKLFELDSNISNRGTNDEAGTGLGLIICKEFVEMNKGRISVESEEGKGSRFIIELPLTN